MLVTAVDGEAGVPEGQLLDGPLAGWWGRGGPHTTDTLRPPFLVGKVGVPGSHRCTKPHLTSDRAFRSGPSSCRCPPCALDSAF